MLWSTVRPRAHRHSRRSSLQIFVGHRQFSKGHPLSEWWRGCRSRLQPIIEGILPAVGSRTAQPPGLIFDAASHVPLPKHDGAALEFLSLGPSG